MRCPLCRPMLLLVCSTLLCSLLAIEQPAIALQSEERTIEIPSLVNGVIDDQDDTSIDFVLPAGKGKSAVADWLAMFRKDGWKVEVLDQDSMSAIYELTRGKLTLEIELDDPGIDEADISISCDSEYQLVIAGIKPAKPSKTANKADGPKIPPPHIKQPSQANALSSETSLGSVAQLDWDIDEEREPHWWVSPDGKRFACRRSTSLGLSVAVDGCELGIWDDIVSPVIFSPDSQHHAFVATRRDHDKEWHYLIVDGIPGEAYSELSRELSFTANNSQVIFGKVNSDATSVMFRAVDPANDDIDTGYHFAAAQNFFFRGPNGGVGYVATMGDREDAVFYNGEQIGQRYRDIDPRYVAVSLDGQCLYFAEISPVKLGLVKNDKIIYEHNQFEQGTINNNSLWLSNNGERVAWGALLNEQEFMFVDGKRGKGFDIVDFPLFSNDGAHFAHLAKKEGSPVVVIDGVESEKYAMASEPQFSDDGRTIAYYAELNQQEFVVVNGTRHKDFQRVTTPLVSRDGSIVAYSARDGELEFMVVNGSVIGKHAVVGSPYFIPSTNKLAWLVFDEGEGWRMLIDGVEKFSFEGYEGTTVFSADGQHVAIVTQNEQGAKVLIDGRSGRTYDRILLDQGGQVRFDKDGICNYQAVRNEELFLVESNGVDESNGVAK